MLESSKDPAKIAGIEIQNSLELSGCEVRAVHEFIENTHLRERVRTLEHATLQDANLPRVKAVEGSDCANVRGGRNRGSGVSHWMLLLPPKLGEILDSVKYFWSQGDTNASVSTATE
jgi:hypothetical protein